MKPCAAESELNTLAPAGLSQNNEQTHEQTHEQNHARNCPRCGGTQFESGQLKIPHSGDVIFRLFKTPVMHRNPNIAVNADICLSCGALELSADPEKARDILK